MQCDIDLSTSLSLPVNRIAQYEYYLRNLADEMDEGTAEREACEKAFVVLAQSSVVIQKNLLESTEVARILAVQRKLKAEGPVTLIKSGRLFITDLKAKKFHVYLFNDILILAKNTPTKDNRFVVKFESDIRKLEMIDVDPSFVFFFFSILFSSFPFFFPFFFSFLLFFFSFILIFSFIFAFFFLLFFFFAFFLFFFWLVFTRSFQPTSSLSLPSPGLFTFTLSPQSIYSFQSLPS